MSVDLEKWREMEAQCTEGEWFYKRHTNEDMNAICFTYAEKEWDLVCAADHAPGEYNGEAICYFRNHAKEMADEVERLRSELARPCYCCRGHCDNGCRCAPFSGDCSLEIDNDTE